MSSAIDLLLSQYTQPAQAPSREEFKRTNGASNERNNNRLTLTHEYYFKRPMSQTIFVFFVYAEFTALPFEYIKQHTNMVTQCKQVIYINIYIVYINYLPFLRACAIKNKNYYKLMSGEFTLKFSKCPLLKCSLLAKLHSVCVEPNKRQHSGHVLRRSSAPISGVSN